MAGWRECVQHDGALQSDHFSWCAYCVAKPAGIHVKGRASIEQLEGCCHWGGSRSPILD